MARRPPDHSTTIAERTPYYDWAWLADPDPGDRHSLLIRRNNTTGELAFYRCRTPGPATLAQPARVAGIRRTVEENFQAANGQVDLDRHEIRRRQSWHRLTALALAALVLAALVLAALVLAGLVLAGLVLAGLVLAGLVLAGPAILALCAADTGTADDHDDRQPDLIPLTVNEIRRLINVLLVRPIYAIVHGLYWSRWRRQQAQARRSTTPDKLNL
jgi:hypothetical protein